MDGAFLNLDLLTVGIAVAGTIVLGFTIYITNSRSATNRVFFQFALITALWGVVNYLSYQFSDPIIELWLVRGVLFFAVLQAFFLYRLFLVFPESEFKFSRKHIYILIPLVALAAIISLSPFAFEGISGKVIPGQVSTVLPGQGIAIFAIIAIGLVLGALYQLLRKLRAAKGSLRNALLILLGGVTLMFLLIIFFNLVATTLFANPRFIPLGALFTFPFIVAASFAILREHLFNIKVIGTTILVFLLSVFSFTEIIFSNTLILILFRSGVFLLVLVFGVSLIRGVLREVEQREKIEKLARELEVANTRLKELDQLKSEFLSVASHQLRAPITAIRGYVANVLDGSYGALPDYLKEPLSVVQESSRVMVSSIEDYLNISRIEQGRMKYETGPVDVTAVAQRAVEEFQPIAKTKNLTLTFNEAPPITITADFGKVKQIFTNLIDNALKYTQQGSVTVSITKEADGITFMTADTGIGIAADEINSLFEKFTRARDANQVNTTGTGLGLYVVKKLVEGQGGTVHAESDGAGKGSRFIVKLPLVAIATEPSQMSTS
jgi:signal transduction histidine kinase